MRNYFFTFLLIIPLLANAQKDDDSKYLGDVVPVVDGKVLFSKEISAPHLTQDQIFNALLTWAESRFTTGKDSWGRVLFTDQEKGQIACKGEEYLVFTAKALSLDRSRTHYRLSIFCHPGKCDIEVSNIYYIYPEDNKERILAEEWITDENTMNKKRTRLYRNTGKFRIKTVDMVEELFDGAQKALGVTTPNTTVVSSTPVTIPAIPVATPAPSVSVQNIPAAPATTASVGDLPGYKRIDPDRIPGNIIKQLSENWSLITAGNDSKFNMMTASWGGLGYLYNKPVAFCFINPARYTYQLMENGDYYTITFYTETYRDVLNYCGSNSGREGDKVKGSGLTPITTPSGSKAFSEAWMIIECKKMVSQQISHEGMADKSLKQNWEGKPTHKMYIGEIINVWVK